MSVPELSPVEEHIVHMIVDGRSHEAIARELGVTVRTVDWHVDRARRKLERAATLHDRMRAPDEPPKRWKDAHSKAALESGRTEKGDSQ